MDYRQTDIAGQTWNRFASIVISNPRLAQPSVSCIEQQVIAIGAGEIIRDIGSLNFHFDPATTFPILNPSTNEAVGPTATGSDVYVLVYSLVMFEAARRDAAIAAQNAYMLANPPPLPPVPPADPAPADPAPADPAPADPAPADPAPAP